MADKNRLILLIFNETNEEQADFYCNISRKLIRNQLLNGLHLISTILLYRKILMTINVHKDGIRITYKVMSYSIQYYFY